MRPIPKNQLDPKIKNVWRISDAISLTVIYLCCVVAWPEICMPHTTNMHSTVQSTNPVPAHVPRITMSGHCGG